MRGEEGRQPRRTRLKRLQITPEEEEAEKSVDSALFDCGLTDPKARCMCITRLANVPESLLLPIWYRIGVAGAPPEGFLKKILGEMFEGERDIRARMLRLSEGKADPDATWQNLSRAEQMRATRLWSSIADSHPTDISTQRKGQRAKIDSALVLYLMFVLMEALGRPKFSYSTQDEVTRGGPMLRALMAALQLRRAEEQSIGAARTAQDPTADAVVTRIIKIARSEEFRQEAERLSLSLTADGVAETPSAFRYLAAEVMKQRRLSSPHGLIPLRQVPR
jgi:hypothetical protein